MAREQHSSMAHKRRIRGLRRNKKIKVAPIVSLPNELVTEVLARVAASSFTDFFNAKLSCKVFYEVAEDRCIFQRASLEKFPVIPWRIKEEASFFLNRCRESGNPEALYRQGVVDFFSNTKVDSAIDCLRKAANSGHVGALYVLGIALIFLGDEFKKLGIELLSHMRQSRITRRAVRRCRENLKTIISHMWVRNALTINTRPVCCEMQDQHKRRVGWSFHTNNGDDDDQQCEACGCDLEVDFIVRALPKCY